MSKIVNIRNPVYAMASTDGQSAEITMYGDIYEQQPTDWYGDPVEGQFILLNEFMEDLKRIEGCSDITIRMNSYGGDAGVSLTIYNRLRELSRNGTKLTCIVDGVAMSGGSIIMCACDTVKANPGSLIMIHKCWVTMIGNYNADELRQAAEQNDAWDKMQVECYKRKCGLTDTVIMHMMAETTYMTGREAMAKGFVDELLEDEPTSIAASADGRSLFVHGRTIHLTAGMFAPDSIPTVTSEASASVEANINSPGVTGSEEGGNSMTIDELRASYPEEIAQVEAAARATVDTTGAVNEAVQNERTRMSEIDEIAGLFSTKLVREAKYGERPCTAAELSLRAARAAVAQGSRFLADAKDDTNQSGTNAVGAAPVQATGDVSAVDDDTPEARMETARAEIREIFKKEDK